MQPIEKLVLMNYLFRFGAALIGLVAMYLGFRLYLDVNAPTSGGDIEAGMKGAQLKVVRGAPGTIMVIAGAFISCVSVWRGASFQAQPGKNGVNYIANAMTMPFDTTGGRQISVDSGFRRMLDSARVAECIHRQNIAQATKPGGKTTSRQRDSVETKCPDLDVMVR